MDRMFRLASPSPDGKLWALHILEPNRGWDLALISNEGEYVVQPFLSTEFNEWFPEFSPDGRHIAYESDETGRFEIYVRPYPGPGKKWRISANGGWAPRWSRDGRELFYSSGKELMSVEVATNGKLDPGAPKLVFEKSFGEPGLRQVFDVSPDGQSFAVVEKILSNPAPTELVLVQNFDEELKRRVPARR